VSEKSNGKVIAVVAIAAALLGGLVLLFATSSTSGPDSSDQVVGALAPEIVGVDTTGTPFDLADSRGKWVFVNFFATWCPPCVAEHPELVAFSERNEGTAEVVSVAFDQPAEVIEEFFESNGGDWPVIAEDTGGTVLDYGVIKLPESFLISPEGVVVEKVAGGVTATSLEAMIAENS